ncbi:uncharacterized protein AB675_4713 [Cyphellophora attinorum]|uniref:WSC domain-containing protein n=1 Tax=Cyphellophora attinorum TaxID=1664694 RepID=A0A0N1H2V2_9EURO|nr:uncharacterized protein AB675_4713 [Phialophora attinorum]KPI38955.1 hypothetical protein AB675_4713 [Phialophora attinorum]
MSNGLCQTQCVAEYAYAVIIGRNCYCSNDVPARQVDTEDCHDPCPGYPPDYCGNATAGYYAYFNLGRAASATVQLSTASRSLGSLVFGSVTTISSAAPSTSAPTSTSTDTSSSILAIQQYIQSALSTQSGPDATDACFLNAGNTRYTSPSWYQNAPTEVQSYFSSTHQDSSATCASLAETLFANNTRHGLSKGALAGIIVGSVLGALLLAALAILLCLCLRRRKRRSAERDSMDEKMSESHKGVAAAAMPTQFDNEHSSEHDFDDHMAVHDTIVHHGPTYHTETTITPSTAATVTTEHRPSSPFFGSPASRTAVAAAALAWARENEHGSSPPRAPAHVENSATESGASSVYETPFEAPQQQHMFSPTHNGHQTTRPEPPARTNTAQDSYILHQQSPYPAPPASELPAATHNEQTIPRKPVGILKNSINDYDSNGRRRRDSEKYTFYNDDQGDDDEHTFHAR